MNYAVPISEWNKLVEEKIDLQEKLKAANKVIEGQNGQMMTLQTQFESLTSQLKIARDGLSYAWKWIHFCDDKPNQLEVQRHEAEEEIEKVRKQLEEKLK